MSLPFDLMGITSLIPHLGYQGVLEVLIIAWMVYEFLFWIQNTKAFLLLRGLLIILAFVVLCAAMRLTTILWILGRVGTIAVTLLVVIFQPELRNALERLGSRRWMQQFPFFSDRTEEKTFSDHTISELVKASFELGRARTGALMVIEQNMSLDDIVRTGIDIDGIVSSQLLINIFEHNTPLHDGAVIIRGNTIVSATCYLPLSENMTISKDLGTRHRAAIGISETTDSLTIVVSEETGRVSVAKEGKIHVIRDQETLREILKELSPDEEEQKKLLSFDFLKGLIKNERKTGQ